MKDTLLKPETPDQLKAESGSSAPICSPYEVLGWAIAECCAILDNDGDPRDVNMSDFIERYENDFKANMKINPSIKSTVIFDNGGGVTLQLVGYSHHYPTCEAAAVDYAAYLRNPDTTGWEGSEEEAEQCSPAAQEVSNGGYKIWDTSGFIQAYEDTDFDHEESWTNVVDFVYHTSENLRPL